MQRPQLIALALPALLLLSCAREDGHINDTQDPRVEFGALYAQCTGEPHFPDATCNTGTCIEDAHTLALFDTWRSAFEGRFGAMGFDDNVAVSNVALDDDALRVDYVLAADWMRSRDTLTIPLLPDNSDVESIARALDAEDIHFAGEVTTISAIEDAIRGCHPDLELDFCNIERLPHFNGAITISGVAHNDTPSRPCSYVSVDVTNAVVLECRQGACPAE